MMLNKDIDALYTDLERINQQQNALNIELENLQGELGIQSQKAFFTEDKKQASKFWENHKKQVFKNDKDKLDAKDLKAKNVHEKEIKKLWKIEQKITENRKQYEKLEQKRLKTERALKIEERRLKMQLQRKKERERGR